ncbi:exported hypothetical protein [uncultured Paludibacter sp.]|uniref:Uncharacterized protein n=1 Tax=uncultured Paludibacter sp. TaxID=497635 RepID=A0A653AGW2_9BACT|nr:exported hypothetical protein [uncultured Paludibacter sp.]
MKLIVKILIFCFACPLFGQNKNDTVFIENDSVHKIFIDYNKNSKYYNEINNFKFDDFDKSTYKNSLKQLKERNQNLNKDKPVIPWKNWIEIEKYKGKFYAYKPCDFLFHYKASINDTTFIDWTGEGSYANKIINQKKIDSKTYVFKLINTYYNYRQEVIIHIIDVQKGIAVFEYIFRDGEKRKFYMIASEKLNKIPIIVYNCNQKGEEFEFDDTEKIDIKIKEGK